METRTLTYERQVKILREVAEVADNSDLLANSLKHQGYISFQAWEEYEISFFNPDEMKDYLKSNLSVRKVMIRSPASLVHEIEKDDRPEFYMFNTRHHLVSVNDPIRIGQRREVLNAEFLQYREKERITFGVKPPKQDQMAYYDYFRESLIDNFGPLGFCLDKYRSKLKFPVLSKTLTPQWDLCWSTGAQPAAFYYWPMPKEDGTFPKMYLELLCYVRHKKSRGSVKIPIAFKEFPIMPLRLEYLVPGFGWAYMQFRGVEELPLVISAHACLYGLVGTRVENILTEALQRDN